MASLNEVAAMICLQAWLYQDPAVLSLPFKSAFLGLCSRVGPCQVVAPESSRLSSSWLTAPVDSACFWFLLSLMTDSHWLRLGQMPIPVPIAAPGEAGI